MTTQVSKLKREERGNALFLILIAVALFAALSYAVTTSGRGSGTIEREQALITASQITQYPAAIRTAVTRMVITGTQVGNIDFDTTPDPADVDDVFGTAGGGVVQQDPPANLGGSATDWTYLPAAGAADGWYITGVGTDTQDTGREVIVALDGIGVSVCGSINRGLGITGNILVEATAVNLAAAFTTAGAGDNAGSFHSYNADPQPFACVRNGAAGNYVYYHAIVEQ